MVTAATAESVETLAVLGRGAAAPQFFGLEIKMLFDVQTSGELQQVCCQDTSSRDKTAAGAFVHVSVFACMLQNLLTVWKH